MIVAGPDGFEKNQYRKFDIKTEVTAGDDYAMMREVLTRRFRRLAVLEEAPVSPDSDGAGACGTDLSRELPVSDQDAGNAGSGTASVGSRITAPTPPTGARGADAIAFGVLRADKAGEAKVADEGGEEAGVIENEDAFPDVPDLVLIDGGAGQLAVACEVMANLGLAGIPVIGVAKGPDRDAGREHFHIPGRPRPLMLEPRDPVLYFIQRLRDEAHRFVIGTHRAKRTKAIGVNPLDEIAGIGPTRKRALLQHFGSAKAVSRAGTEDLKAVEGISAEMARKIYDFFHERSG
jgi:excinuclease ABC subunit C